MNRLKIQIFSYVLITVTVMVLITLLLRTTMAEATPLSQGKCGTWSVVSSPNIKSQDNSLGAVAAVSASDIWAVGTYLTAGAIITHTLIDHWDGTRWSIISSPNVGTLSNGLFGVAAVSSHDVWAVGYYFKGSFIPQTLIEHWNGSQWSIVPSPNPGSSDNFLSGVTAASSNNVWAVGHYSNHAGSFRALIEHWNGSQWSVAANPNPGSVDNILVGVAATSPTSVWTVGEYVNTSSPVGTLIEHWNGSHWSLVPGANPGSSSSALFGIAALSTSAAWAVGELQNGHTARRTLIEQWDGSHWKAVTSPNAGSSDNKLFSVAATSTSNAWAVGNYISTKGNAQTLIEHWNGSHWLLVDSPSPGSGDNKLGGVAAIAGNSAWAVGVYDNGGPAKSLVEQYC